MGRSRKPYTEECMIVRHMAPGTTKLFMFKHPYGFTNILRRHLCKRHLSDSYSIATDLEAGSILVYRKVVNLKDYDDIYKQGGLFDE